MIFVSGDDDWVVAEARRRLVAAFSKSIPDNEIAEYDGTGSSVKEAVSDAATIGLFVAHRFVTLDVTDLLRSKKLTAEELDSLLDDAADARDDAGLRKLARKARALLVAAGQAIDGDLAEVARKAAGRVKRADRASELAHLLARAEEEGESSETALDRLLDYATRASRGDNVLLLTAKDPDREHRGTQALRRAASCAELVAGDEAARRDRLAALGLERALERGVICEPEVFDTLMDRGRLEARGFLLELGKLLDAAPSGRVTAEAAARLVVNEKKEYGSDFVDAVAARRLPESLALLDRLLSGDEFSAFRPQAGGDAGGGGRKGPKGDGAFFPLLGLLAGELRRMLALRAAAVDRGGGGRRPDYRTFVDQTLPALKKRGAGLPGASVDGHPFVLHRSFLAAQAWSVPQLAAAVCALEDVDRGVKTGVGPGRELLEAFLLTRLK